MRAGTKRLTLTGSTATRTSSVSAPNSPPFPKMTPKSYASDHRPAFFEVPRRQLHETGLARQIATTPLSTLKAEESPYLGTQWT
jgi:hypothetical protein